MRRLTKTEAERLLRSYDDDPVGALTAALVAITGLAGVEFDDAVRQLAVDDGERAALLARTPDALDALARRLNEERTAALR